MNALSLFANVGVAEAYLSDIGINVVVANELEEDRARFYHHLYPTCNMICGDITDSVVYDSIITASKEQQIEMILATPPCQGMSIAGHNSPYDERNSLIKYAVDAILDLSPKYVFMENVPQQLDTPIYYQDQEMLIPAYLEKRLGDKYRFNSEKITNAMYYGVPQMRRRSVILLVRKDIDFIWEFPEPEEKVVTLSQAFDGIPDLWPEIREKGYRDKLPKNSEEALSFHKWHRPPCHVWRNVECMLHTPAGNTAFDNPFYYPKKTNGEKVKGYDTTYHRLFWEKPAATITKWNGIMGSQNNVHPGKLWKYDENGDPLYTNPRVLTIYELLIVSSLPTDWDMIHIKCVGGGGGGSAFNSTAGTAGSASSFGSIVSAAGGNGGTTGQNTLPAVQDGSNRGSLGCWFSHYGRTWYSYGQGGDGWLPGYSGGPGIPSILLLPHTIASLSYSSSSSSLNFGSAFPTNASFTMFNRPFAVSDSDIAISTINTPSNAPYSYPGYVYGYYSSSYYNSVSAGAVGYGAGGSSGGSRPNRCNYGSGANSGVIKDINYKIVNDNAIAVTVGTGGTGGSTYGGGGANGCVAIWW